MTMRLETPETSAVTAARRWREFCSHGLCVHCIANASRMILEALVPAGGK